MKQKSLHFVTNYLVDIINSELDDILLKISQDYNLDYNMLKKKYIDTTIDNVNIDIENNIKNTIDCNIRCMGIIKSGAQCARTRKNNSEFCLIHQKSLKFGKIHSNQMSTHLNK